MVHGNKKHLLEIKGSLFINRDQPVLNQNFSSITLHLYGKSESATKNFFGQIIHEKSYATIYLQENRAARLFTYRFYSFQGEARNSTICMNMNIWKG